MLDAAMATSVPDIPMLNPMCAVFRAGASLVLRISLAEGGYFNFFVLNRSI
jgi:hypothetical protein